MTISHMVTAGDRGEKINEGGSLPQVEKTAALALSKLLEELSLGGNMGRVVVLP